MTDPVVSLDTDRISVEPGGQVSVGIKITNPGTIVEGYRIEVIGDGVAAWGEALPPEISVYPQQDAAAVVVFSPPGGTGAPGGTWPFGIRVRSTEDDDASAVAEGDLEIGKVFGLQAKLIPVNSSGRWRGRHVVQFSNWGNSPAKLKLTATNPDEAVGFMIRPEMVDLPLGGTVSARVWVRTKKPFLRGTPVRLPFTVVGEPEGAPPQQTPTLSYGTPDRPSVDGALNQKPIISRGTVMVVALALIAVGGGVAWALTRPAPAQATFQELGPPDQPKNIAVTAVDSETARIAWDPVQNIQSYTVVRDDSGKQSNSQSVPATDSAKDITGLTPGAKACFKVQAVRGKLPGPFSDAGCVDLPAPSTSPSPGNPTTSASPGADGSSPGVTASSSGSSGSSESSGTGTGTGGGTGGGTDTGGGQPSQSSGGGSSTGTSGGGSDTTADPSFKGKFFAVDFWTVSGTVVDQQKRLSTLRSQQPNSGLVLSSAYPKAIIPIKNESWILYAGPFDTSQAALAACPAVKAAATGCLVTQLDP